MEEKINILKKLYVSKEVPSSLETFDWSLVEKSEISERRPSLFKRNSYLYVGALFVIVLFFGVFALIPKNSVMDTISGTIFNQDSNKPIPSVIPQITPTDIDLVKKPTPTPTTSPAPTISQKSPDSVGGGKKDDNNEDLNSKSHFENPETNENRSSDNQKAVQGVSDEDQQDEDQEDDKNKNAKNGQEHSNSGKSKKD